MLSMLKLVDIHNPNSLASRFRARRFRIFEGFFAALPRPVHIIDIGGTNSFWERVGWAGQDDVQITLLNLFPQARQHANIAPVVGNATNLSDFGPGSFDVAFSNSVIEHLSTFENQRKMAAEVRRVAKAYWVQTPNFWFPIEPHFHVPGWQWMPEPVRVSMLSRWKCGWLGPCKDPLQARELVAEIRLLTCGELRDIFPEAQIMPERFAGFTKSWTAIHGFRPITVRDAPSHAVETSQRES